MPPRAASVNRHEDASVNGLDTEIPLSHFHEGFNFHEAFARGTGGDGVLGRGHRTRHDPGLAVGAPGVVVDFGSGEIWNDQEGQEEEGEEVFGLLELDDCRADEVNDALPFPSQTRP